MIFSTIKACVYHLAEQARSSGQPINAREIFEQVSVLMDQPSTLDSVRSYLSTWKNSKTSVAPTIGRARKKLIKLPQATTYNAKTSTITKAFVDAIAPARQPTAEEHQEFLSIFPLANDRHSCAYCGGPYRYFEHFRPLVNDKQPTGYGSDIYNLVPSCSKCNEAKGGKDWKVFMTSLETAAEPGAHQMRLNALKKFESWGIGKVIHVKFEEIIAPDLWERYVSDRLRIHQLLEECYELQKTIREKVRQHVNMQ